LAIDKKILAREEAAPRFAGLFPRSKIESTNFIEFESIKEEQLKWQTHI